RASLHDATPERRIMAADPFQQIDEILEQAMTELAAVADAGELEQFRIKFLGTKGLLRGLMKLLGQVPKEQKPALGQRVNAASDQINNAFEERKSSIGGAVAAGLLEDVTEPGKRPQI